MSARPHIPEHTQLMVFAKTFGVCWYCGRVVERKAKDYVAKGHLDHVIPVSQGGRDTVANLVPCCLACNLLKGAKTLEEFRGELREKQLSWIAEALAEVEERHWFLIGQAEEEMIYRLRCWLINYPRSAFYGDSRDAGHTYCI